MEPVRLRYLVAHVVPAAQRDAADRLDAALRIGGTG
jgi:hypothetical protein